MVLVNEVRIRDKMQILHKETACDGAKSNVAKWNLISRIQFKRVKNCLMFMHCNDWICFDWTLDVVFVVHDSLACVLQEKERKKHVLTLKLYDKNKCEPFISR